MEAVTTFNQGDNDIMAEYFRAVLDEGLFKSERNLKFHLERLFGDLDLKNTDFLDVGSGAGLNGLYAACRGARSVVCLEPEIDGSTSGVQNRFRRLQARLGLNNIRLEPSTLQSYDSHGQRFDVILSHNSINHLNEPACVALQYDPKAQAEYHEIFTKLYALAKPGARIIVCDCTRHNFFGDLGLRNPFMPTIEWEKHQSPEVWSAHMAKAGFTDTKISWSAFNRLGYPGVYLLGNKLAAYFLKGHFCFTMQKPKAAA